MRENKLERIIKAKFSCENFSVVIKELIKKTLNDIKFELGNINCLQYVAFAYIVMFVDSMFIN